jgi:hypothetical protein
MTQLHVDRGRWAYVDDDAPTVEELLAGLGKLPTVEPSASPADFRPALVVGLGLGLLLTVALGIAMWTIGLAASAHVD